MMCVECPGQLLTPCVGSVDGSPSLTGVFGHLDWVINDDEERDSPVTQVTCCSCLTSLTVTSLENVIEPRRAHAKEVWDSPQVSRKLVMSSRANQGRSGGKGWRSL